MGELGQPTTPPRLLTDAERAALEADRAAHAPGPWYDHIVQELARAQVGTRDGHAGLSTRWIELAELITLHGPILLDALVVTLRAVGDAHRALAATVPDAAQAAADLGTAAERHDVNNLRGVLQGEQQLRERDMQGVLSRLTSLEAAFGEMTREAKRIHEQAEQDRQRADRQRRLMLQALGVEDGGTHADR